MQSFMEKFPVDAFISVIAGLGFGMATCVVGQRYLNVQQSNECKKQQDTHKLVTLSSWVGDARYCIHAKYLAQ
jgi:hypothetical protein